MAAQVLWTPGKSAFFLQETYVHKIPRFREGVFWFGGGSADFIFMGARIFRNQVQWWLMQISQEIPTT